MPTLTIPILADGALVTFVVAVSGPRQLALRSAGQAIPGPIVGPRGLIDTGASETVVDSKVVQSLGLMPTGSVLVHTPSTGATPTRLNQFDVALAIVMDQRQVHVCKWTMPILESDLSAQQVDALIGRDVLARGLFIYDGTSSIAKLSF